MTTKPLTLPPDDLSRNLALARPNDDQTLPHLGVVGGTYTILLTGQDTAGRFCLFDMIIPPDSGPPLHRHDFEEMFTLLEGELEFTFRGTKVVLRAGETANVPANAPHEFRNVSQHPARFLCLCSPAGQEEFFTSIGIPLATRTTPCPKLEPAAQAAFKDKVVAIAGKYRIELLGP